MKRVVRVTTLTQHIFLMMTNLIKQNNFYHRCVKQNNFRFMLHFKAKIYLQSELQTLLWLSLNLFERDRNSWRKFFHGSWKLLPLTDSNKQNIKHSLYLFQITLYEKILEWKLSVLSMTVVRIWNVCGCTDSYGCC